MPRSMLMRISALQIVSQTLEISVLRLSIGEYAQVPKRHTHPFRPDVRFLMTFANRHSQAAPIGSAPTVRS